MSEARRIRSIILSVIYGEKSLPIVFIGYQTEGKGRQRILRGGVRVKIFGEK